SEVGHDRNHLPGGGSSRAAACSFWCERDRGSSREAFQALRDPDPAMQRMTAIAGSSPLQCGISTGLMSEVGQRQTKRHQAALSALPPKADMDRRDGNVCFVPKADSCSAANDAYPMGLTR